MKDAIVESFRQEWAGAVLLLLPLRKNPAGRTAGGNFAVGMERYRVPMRVGMVVDQIVSFSKPKFVALIVLRAFGAFRDATHVES
jgi:hypothetical protein